MNLKIFCTGVLTASVASSAAWAETGQAVITGSKPAVRGLVQLTESPEGLKVDAEFTQAPPGGHAFHIHEFGSCADQAKAAGSHYNPAGHPHGLTAKEGVEKTHAGDFGNVAVEAKGEGALHVVIPGLTLSNGEYSVAGRAFVLHEKPDDFSQPTGNAGGRIGCGTIVISGK